VEERAVIIKVVRQLLEVPAAEELITLGEVLETLLQFPQVKEIMVVRVLHQETVGLVPEAAALQPLVLVVLVEVLESVVLEVMEQLLQLLVRLSRDPVAEEGALTLALEVPVVLVAVLMALQQGLMDHLQQQISAVAEVA
jgi:hypothetical protein